MVVFASGYILYDTSNVLHHYRTEQYVAASLALFASVGIVVLVHPANRDFDASAISRVTAQSRSR